MTVLQQVRALGQQIWLDNLSRSLIQSGGLAQMLEAGVCGVTSNPAIFQKAFAGDALYAEDVARLKRQNLSAKARYELLAVADVQAACDVCLPLYQESGGQAGLVSLEVAPELANDTAGTVAEALRLHTALMRPNVMIKVPATDAGLAAMTQLVAKGLHINLTLLFSRAQVAKAYLAYCAGLRERQAQGLPVCGIQVVASFFLSRIDAALDITLPAQLQGQTAVALAKAAYRDWQVFFGAEGFAGLLEAGAGPMRLLWASTGTKNAAYSDVLYVESVIGPQTVNTVPDGTLAAFIDHGVAALTLTDKWLDAEAVLAKVTELGIDLEVLAARLQEEGLHQFEVAFSALLLPLGDA
ncbi:transaldolase [Snodgrassella sp. CFCC 13594]|uniref:transaldolase n=1 Tax=Snodgrassella sp. CFCC 13594 TaxID=1775559 RepID=UPI0008314752|nr:transaldolase [Snodgrassella sp. CFCC 13594]